MEKLIKNTDWVDNHLFLAHRFNRELKEHQIEKVSDLEKLSLYELLKFQTITIARLRRVIVFMHHNGLQFRTLGKA